MAINEATIGHASASRPMYFIALYIEILRRRPVIVFWLAVLAQAVLWTLVPTLFYAAPPGDVANVLAVGHEFAFGTDFGPPLAFWLAEIAYRLAGGRMFGVYLLSQICLVVTCWSVFALGSAVVGRSHAAVAVLLMVGISAFTVATPEFGPPILTMALWALMLLHLWRAVGKAGAATGLRSRPKARCCCSRPIRRWRSSG
jgi:4-amino-4-deoxy-L-arabinose transferase-like glycosyltransferase